MGDLLNGIDTNSYNLRYEPMTLLDSMSFIDIFALKMKDMNKRHYCNYFGTMGLFFLIICFGQIIWFNSFIQNTREFTAGVIIAFFVYFISIMMFISLFLLIKFMCKFFNKYQNTIIIDITICLFPLIIIINVVLFYFLRKIKINEIGF